MALEELKAISHLRSSVVLTVSTALIIFGMRPNTNTDSYTDAH